MSHRPVEAREWVFPPEQSALPGFVACALEHRGRCPWDILGQEGGSLGMCLEGGLVATRQERERLLSRQEAVTGEKETPLPPHPSKILGVGVSEGE